MNKHNLQIFAAVIMLIVASLACGSFPKVVQDISTKDPSNKQSTPTTLVQPTPTTLVQPTPTSPASSQVQTYNVGDVVLAGTHTITLNNAQITGEVLQANFTIVNKGSVNLRVNPMASFVAQDSNGMQLEQDTLNCPSGIPNGSVLPGGMVTGNICWKGVLTGSCKISYAPMVVGENFIAVGYVVAIWEVMK
jgi:hypothetical protein